MSHDEVGMHVRKEEYRGRRVTWCGLRWPAPNLLVRDLSVALKMGEGEVCGECMDRIYTALDHMD
jgi:hypothetical protein